METKAKLKHLRQSPRKVRLVADLIRGMDTAKAQSELRFANKKAAFALLKLLNSAIANAENNFKLKQDNLYIKSIQVDQGPVLKRWRARAFGRAAAIRKKTSHIAMVLSEKVETKNGKDSKKKKIEKATVVKSLLEVKPKPEEKSKETNDTDINKGGKDKYSQHSAKLAKKENKSGWKDKVFRRKSD